MKRGQRATHRTVTQFEGGTPFRKGFLSRVDAEDAARRQRAVIGPNGETCTVTVEPILPTTKETR